jgi:hypothetical protein
MPRFFNTAGPCNADDHYMLPPEQRIPDLQPFVEQKQYFVLHAARQTGKSTAMIAFTARLREQGIVALYATLETSQEMDALEEAEALWISSIRHAARIQLPEPQRPTAVDAPVGERLLAMLSAWSEAVHPAPVVLVLDEADVVRGAPLVSLLCQLRAGFLNRPQHFPASIALVGMRDLRDYLTQSKDGVPVNPGSPFNIKSASLTLRVFKGGKSPQKVRDAGIQQLTTYLDTLGEQQGWLILFDQRREKDWEQRLWQEKLHNHGKTLLLHGA